MIRRLLVYWQCPRHVMSLGGYPERISPWLAVLPHPCCVQPLLRSCVCMGTQQPPGGVLALPPTPLGCQLRSSGTLPWHLWWRGTCMAKGKAEQQSQNVSLYLCKPQRLQIPSKSAPEECVLPQQFTGHGLLRLLQITLRPKRRHTITEHQKCGNRPEKERFGGHLHPRNLLSYPQIWKGWSTLDSPCVSSHHITACPHRNSKCFVQLS